jgi:hypothetical protein
MGALLLIAGIGGLAWFFYSASQNEPDVQICPAPLCPGPLGTGVQFNVAGALSAVQVAQLARTAGFTDDILAVAVAICFAESRGIPSKYNPELKAVPTTPNLKGSYGLWQIYLFKHPEFEGQNLYDPQVNAAAAFSVYQGRGNSFRPWATYTTTIPSLSYAQFMPMANDAVAALNQPTAPPVDSPVQVADDSPAITCCGVSSTE